MSTKLCVQCGETKALAEFYTHRVKADGTVQYSSYCKPCLITRRNKPGTHESPFKKTVMTDEERAARSKELDRKYNQQESRKQYRAEWAAEHKEAELAKARRYYQRHRQEIREKARLKHIDDPTPMLEAAKRWRDANKDVVNAQTNRRRARILNADGRYTAQEWQDVKAQQDYTCLACGKREPEIKLTVDHVIALTKGGSNGIENIQGLCQSCNSRKKANHVDYRTLHQQNNQQ